MPQQPKSHKPHKPTKRKDGRQSACKRGYGRGHAKWRKMVLRRDTICLMCNREVATVADHITPISRGGSKYDLSNGQGLCASCHGIKTCKEDGGFGLTK